MRSVEEVGAFNQVGDIVFTDRSNEAYRTYASVYLDFVDDNIGHFKWRDIDISPIQDFINDIVISDEQVCKAYLDSAVSIIKVAISDGYFKTFSEVYETYPMMKERKEEIEREFYEIHK